MQSYKINRKIHSFSCFLQCKYKINLKQITLNTTPGLNVLIGFEDGEMKPSTGAT